MLVASKVDLIISRYPELDRISPWASLSSWISGRWWATGGALSSSLSPWIRHWIAWRPRSACKGGWWAFCNLKIGSFLMWLSHSDTLSRCLQRSAWSWGGCRWNHSPWSRAEAWSSTRRRRYTSCTCDSPIPAILSYHRRWSKRTPISCCRSTGSSGLLVYGYARRRLPVLIGIASMGWVEICRVCLLLSAISTRSWWAGRPPARTVRARAFLLLRNLCPREWT